MPKRLKKFSLEVEPTKTQIIRFSRFHPGMSRRFTFLGFEFFWFNDRQGNPRVKRRTARKKLQGAEKRIRDWIKGNRHKPVKTFFKKLNSKLIGHYNYYGVRGNSRSIWRFYRTVIFTSFIWLNRRSQRKSYTWERFKRVLEYMKVARPRITEYKRLHRVAY